MASRVPTGASRLAPRRKTRGSTPTSMPSPSGVHRDADGLVPGLPNAEIVETWMGFRLQSADGFQEFDSTAIEGFVVATGHFTMGIAVAPVRAELVADLEGDGRMDPLPTPCGPNRFA